MAFSVRIAHAQQSYEIGSIVLNDTFENGLEKWQAYRQETALWQTVDETAEGYIPDYYELSELILKPEYWDTSWIGYRYELDYKRTDGTDTNITFGFQDENNWYDVHLGPQGYELAQRYNGAVVLSDRPGFLPVKNQWQHMTVEFTPNRIKVWINDQLLSDIAQVQFNPGPPALRVTTGANPNTRVQFDNVQVTLLETGAQPTDLAVTQLKQHDPRWGQLEYDSATSWNPTNPSIGRWGCLLTSVVMVMEYHGIDHFPDGSTIDPSTLNDWLQTQADGYIGNGLVNWHAITRLTQEISQAHTTPKLEYTRHTGDDQVTAIATIQNQQPPILEIPGHFLVADGVDNSGDITIADPAYTYQTFSQHSQALQSTRLLTPSHTDLSYFLITHPANTEITIKDIDGTIIPHQTTIEKIDGFESAQENTEIYTTTVAKPNSGKYLITYNQTGFSETPITLYTYSERADVTIATLLEALNQGHGVWQIDFDKTQPEASITEIDLEHTLLTAFQAGDIFLTGVYLEARDIVRTTTYRTEDTVRILQFFQTWIDDFSYFMSHETRELLHTQAGFLINALQ